MNKFLTSLLFTIIAITLFTCNTRPANSETTTNKPLTAISETTEVTQVKPAVDFAYETQVIAANLPSPRKEMSGHIDDITLKVNYGSPSIKGRNVWGALVPFGKVWRTGANEATTFTIGQAIQVNGQELSAGTYGLFTLPTRDNWQVIFNKIYDQWGAYEYDESKDVLRISSTPETTATSSETVEFIINDDQLVLLWEKLRIPVSISSKL